MNHWLKGIMLFLLLCLGTACAGCALFVVGVGVGAGVGAAEYIYGELKQVYAASMERAWDASLAATQEFKMQTSEKYIDNLDQNRLIKGKTTEGKDFQIALEAMSKDVTMVKVRIGMFGDEALSKEIQEAIARNLKKQ